MEYLLIKVTNAVYNKYILYKCVIMYWKVISMIIQNTAVNIRFSRIENIKRKYILNEEILKEKFNEAIILPIPDDAPMEVPRILIKSKGEHSQINIAPEAITMQTIYTDEHKKNWRLCEEYISSRVQDIFKLTDEFTCGNYHYIGVVTNLIWDTEMKDGNKVLFRNLMGKEATNNLDDLVVKYTYVVDQKYYVNITLQSAKVYNGVNGNEAGAFADENLQTHTISIVLDINDRYSFNQNKGYISNKEKFEEIITLTTDIVNNKLKNLVEKGEY